MEPGAQPMNSHDLEARLAVEIAVCADALRREAMEEAARSVVRVIDICDRERHQIRDTHLRAATILLDALLVPRGIPVDARAAAA